MKKVALIHDLSGFGKCSLTAAIPVISAMGVQACPLPTAILSGQTGFSDYYYDDCTNRMNFFTDHWKKMDVKFDGIYSGYLGSSKQVENVLYFLDCFKKENTLFMADPVMGDHGRCIKTFSNELLETMKVLTEKADVITPNLTELCLLADRDYETLVSYHQEKDYLQRVLDIGMDMKEKNSWNQTIIVTGIVTNAGDEWNIGNLILSEAGQNYLEAPYNKKSFSGTGDLFASVVMGALMQGRSVLEAVRITMDFLQPAIEDASRENVDRNQGVSFEPYLWKLTDIGKEKEK